MHGGTGGVHRVENYKVGGIVSTAFESNDRKRVFRTLEINRRQVCFVNVRVVANSDLSEISFYGEEKLVMSLNFAFWSITIAERLNCAVDLAIEEQCLCLIHC
jgi:hypothetical protein